MAALNAWPPLCAGFLGVVARTGQGDFGQRQRQTWGWENRAAVDENELRGVGRKPSLSGARENGTHSMAGLPTMPSFLLGALD
jgi:hypothetical protein